MKKSWVLISLYVYLLSLSLSLSVSVSLSYYHYDINNIQCLDNERDALLQFKHGITDACGLLASWRDDANCCQWHGVHCSNSTGHVIALNVHSDDVQCPLQGEVSPSLAELKHLKLLNLSFLDVFGDIPPQLGNLSELTTLHLSSTYSSFRMNLDWISRLSLLRYLGLNTADLTKATNWMTIVNNFRFLTVLRLDYCFLPMEIPSSLTHINSSATLRSISLGGNGFNDTSVVLWLFNFLEITSRLVYLDLSWNAFQSLVPTDFGSMHSLSFLDLSQNKFQGPIPNEFANLHSLSYLSLSDNNFQGGVSKIVTKLCNLEHLYLFDNNFTGDLTEVIQGLARCENSAILTLDLSENMFSGSIPDSIGSFSLLRELYLQGNRLNGEISQSIGQLSMLEVLAVSSNSLEGTLSQTHFRTLSRLRELYLSDNRGLVMKMDPSWDPPFQLDIVGLRSCKLGPFFPNWLQMQTNFSSLDVSNAAISDRIPLSFLDRPSNLQYLNMSNNQFYGMLSNLTNNWELVYNVDLSSNLLEGAVPSGFNKVEYLYLNDNRFSDASSILCPRDRSALLKLDLSNNWLRGELPDCWMNHQNLSSLHLENNRFSGNLPESIGTLKHLKFLHLYNNSFSGAIPTSFENCTSLIFLNLGYNSFTGYIPPWIGNALRHVSALIVRKNQFIGHVPVSLCQLADLQILDIAVNNISGVIPNCIGNFSAMTSNRDAVNYIPFDMIFTGKQGLLEEGETSTFSWKGKEQRFKDTMRLVKSIDLSHNELHGKIPDGITGLIGLISLDLSRNKLSGNIPSEIGNLTNLELLDLSDNHLTGDIPVSLARVNTLGTLDLSNNNLSGKIPVSTQLQSFDASSFKGNLALCGAPLQKCPTDKAPPSGGNGDYTTADHDDNGVFPELYISVVLGFIIGFWGVCGSLVIKRSWRHAFFRLLYNIRDYF